MFHELIIALNGIPGDVFEFDGKSFQMSPRLQLPLMHPSDLSVLNGMLEIATYFKELKSFQEKVNGTNLDFMGKQPHGCGIYVNALCNGIQELLQDYLDVVDELEMQILNDPYITLNHIRVYIEPFRALFQSLSSLILKVKVQNRSSTVLMEIVKNEFDTNVQIQDSLQKLIPWMNRMLFKHITNWVVYGSLMDPNGEFFICKAENNSVIESPAKKSGIKDKYDVEKYIVDYSLVPNQLSVFLVDKILFIGNAVKILEKSEKTKTSLFKKQNEFCIKMKNLSLETFRTEELSDAIDEIHTSIGKDLHHLVVTETDLPKHIGIVKDFYLTGRGELFHDFLFNLKQLAKSKFLVLSDIRNAFTLSAQRVQVQEDISQRISVSLPADVTRVSLASVISNISLEMTQEWPLHILFTEESIKEYNELFRFLLQIRWIQLELNTIWLNTRKIFRFPVPKGPADLKIVMSYFIDHLQHYLQEDVLESHYVILLTAVEKSANFDEIKKAHITFRHNILLQSFRNNPKVKHFVEQITNVCGKYVNFMNSHIEYCEAKDRPINEGISKEISEFYIDFKKHMELLLNLLKSLATNPQKGQHLRQFLLRLDYNSYFTSTISGLNLPI